MMIASMNMYIRPELEKATNRYWALIRKNLSNEGMDSPEHLSQNADPMSVWTDPDLVLSQTCGMPYRKLLHGKVTLVGTPDYAEKDCPPGYYRSAIIARLDDPRSSIPEFKDSVFAYNETISQSGYAAPYWHLKPYGFWFQNRLQVHQHIESALAVSDGRADIAAIDATTWKFLNVYEEFTSALRVLEWTDPTPALPYITGKNMPRDLILKAVKTALNSLTQADRNLLGIKQIIDISPETYLSYKNPNHLS